MPVFDLFSKRQKRLREGPRDIFVYDVFPQPFRVQVIHIWRDAIGNPNEFMSEAESVYRAINDILCREYGVLGLTSEPRSSPITAVMSYLLALKDGEKVLDVIELSFRCIERLTQAYHYRNYSHPKIAPDAAVEELNARFLEHGNPRNSN